MSKPRYMTSKEAAEALNITLSTLYAYVSRGLIRSEASGDGGRRKRYYVEDIEKLLARKDGRRNPEKLAQDALHWGAPVLESAIALITEGQLYYRGQAVQKLAREATLEQVAALIWTGDMNEANRLFDDRNQVSAQKYETMLLHIEMDGADMTTIQMLQTVLPAAAADDISAYDLRPASIPLTGARILRLLVSVAAGDVPETPALADMLWRGWVPNQTEAARLLQAALIVCADHELNASSFTARVVASAGATPYDAVIAGLAALRGVKHTGDIIRTAALFEECRTADQAQRVIRARMQRGEPLPGFGHPLYRQGDPRATALLNLLEDYTGGQHDQWVLAQAIQAAVYETLGDLPSIDFALVTLTRVLGLESDAAMTLFALGRSVGWIGQIIEQYEADRLIRPRARYNGEQPQA